MSHNRYLLEIKYLSLALMTTIVNIPLKRNTSKYYQRSYKIIRHMINPSHPYQWIYSLSIHYEKESLKFKTIWSNNSLHIPSFEPLPSITVIINNFILHKMLIWWIHTWLPVYHIQHIIVTIMIFVMDSD